MEVGDVHAHGLLAHRTLVAVTRRLGEEELKEEEKKITNTPSAPTWLWSGNGMMDAHTPRIIDGWISQCV
jgi:hypothetical protein